MTNLQKALYDFWSSFGIPAWEHGTVPESAVLPYFTFETVKGAAVSAGIITATAWLYDDGEGVNAKRAALLDAVANAIPPSGRKIPVGNEGFIVLYRNSSSFQRNVQDENDRKVLGGMTSLEVHYYTI